MVLLRGNKTTTNVVGVPVVPNALEVLQSLYKTTLGAVEMYEPHGYNNIVTMLTEYRLKLVQESKDVEDFEKKLGLNLDVEEVIEQAEDELELLEAMNEKIKPWDKEDDDEEFEETYYPTMGTRPFEDEARWQIVKNYYNSLPLDEQRNFMHPKHMAVLELMWASAAKSNNIEKQPTQDGQGIAADRGMFSPFWPSPMESPDPAEDALGPYDVPSGNR